MTERQAYSKEFKIEAVRLLQEGNKTTSELALELGVRRNQLYKWQEQARKEGSASFSRGIGRPKQDQLSEVDRLHKELKEVKLERDILKKAAAYFAKDLA